MLNWPEIAAISMPDSNNYKSKLNKVRKNSLNIKSTITDLPKTFDKHKDNAKN